MAAENYDDALWEARFTIIKLGTELATEYRSARAQFPSPEHEYENGQKLLQRLTNFGDCNSRPEFNRRIKDIAEHIIEFAVFETDNEWIEPRTPCPLCRSTPAGHHGSYGFAKGGLRGHLTGPGTNFPCEVLTAVRKLGHKQREAVFAETEAKEKSELAQRHKTEKKYRIHPNDDPGLIDEFLVMEPRSPEQLATAEQRLSGLGFTTNTAGNVVTYKFEADGYTVLADPHRRNMLRFCVYRDTSSQSRRRLQTAHFHLLDGWKDPVGKFNDRLQKAIAELKRRPNHHS